MSFNKMKKVYQVISTNPSNWKTFYASLSFLVSIEATQNYDNTQLKTFDLQAIYVGVLAGTRLSPQQVKLVE